MVLKFSFLLLVLTVSQAFGTSVNTLQLRGLEVLASRQSGCPVCTTVSDAITKCVTSSDIIQCSCTSTISSQVQSCVDCGISANVGSSLIETLKDSYSKLCKNTPTITEPGSSTSTATVKTSSGTSDKGKRAGVAAIGAIVGAALLL